MGGKVSAPVTAFAKSSADFPDFNSETGFKPVQDEFIDEVPFDGTKPNDYLKKFDIGLKGKYKV